MPNGAVTSPNGAVTPQSDSFLGMLLELLKGRWTEREEQTGQPMGIQNVAALSALEFLKPPQKMVPTKNPKLLKMGLKEEMNPAYLEMIAMGTMGKPKGVSGPKTPAIKQTSIKDIIQEGIDEYPSTDAADSHVSKLMQYIRSGEKLPPIVVSPSKYLSDGRHRLEAYRRLGYKKVPTVEGYHVGTSSVTTKSGKKIPLEKVSVEGQEFLRKVKKAQVSKPSAPTPVKFKMAEDFDYSGHWVGTVGGKEHKIWRETQTGGYTIQGWWYDEAGSFLGMTKKEAIEKLQSMEAGLGGR